jgi:hypothetical protein
MAIDKAIAAAEVPEQRGTVQVTMHTGRVVVLNIPADMTLEEMLSLCGYIGSKLAPAIASQQQPRARSRILVPGPARA